MAKKQKSQTTEVKLYDIQLEAFNALFNPDVDTVVFSGGLGSGKSHLLAFWLLYMCVTYPGTRYLVGRKRLIDLKASTLKKIFETAQLMGITHLIKHDKLNNMLYFDNGSEVILRALDMAGDEEGISLGSIEITAACIEEAGEVARTAYSTLLQRCRFRLKENGLTPKVLIVCNPTEGWLKTRFYTPWRSGTLQEGVFFCEAGPFQNPFLDEGYLKNLTREKLGDWEYETRVLMNWNYSSGNLNLFDGEGIDQAFYRDAIAIEQGQRYLSVDVSGEGKDNTVLAIWQGWHLLQITKHNHLTAPETARLILNTASEHRIQHQNIVIDAIGIGSGVADMVPGCVRFKANERAKNSEGYENLKAQCFYKLAERFRNSQIKLSCYQYKEDVIQQLVAHKRFDVAKDGLGRVTPKDRVIQAIGCSPDIADAIMMRAYWDAVPHRMPTFDLIR